MKELWRESAVSLADLVRRGEVTSREVAESHLARVDDVNHSLNAVVEIRPEEVLAAADRADAALRAGHALGALHGVPFTVKTNIDVAGYATTRGSFALTDMMVTLDAPVVERMRSAGAIVLGRTNMPDLGLRLNTESSLYGATHNPWRHGYSAGGSSGGEAAALASGMSPLGLGNDIGGSLRNPAFCCGVASIKPTRGRVPAQDSSALYETSLSEEIMLAEGVVARHVADLRRGLEVVMGAHRDDPQSLDLPWSGAPVPKRVALVPEPFGGQTDPEIAEGVRRAGRVLEEAGYHVEEVEPPLLFESYVTWAELMAANLVDSIDPATVIGEDGLRFLELSSADFPAATAQSLALMHRNRFSVARAWRQFFTAYPLVVGPTWTQPPFPLGFDIQDQESAMKVLEMVRFVLPANVLGLPAACVPVGFARGFPTGVQIIGDLFREDLCLDAADVIEQSLGVLTPIDPR